MLRGGAWTRRVEVIRLAPERLVGFTELVKNLFAECGRAPERDSKIFCQMMAETTPGVLVRKKERRKTRTLASPPVTGARSPDY